MAESNKERIRSELKKKVAADKHIFGLQWTLLQKDVDPKHFEQCCLYFQPTHYAEVVEERFCSGLCGYPLCNALLPKERFSSSGYRISVTQRMVFSVGESNKFCRYACIEASAVCSSSLSSDAPQFRSLPIDTSWYDRIELFQALRQNRAARAAAHGDKARSAGGGRSSGEIQQPDSSDGAIVGSSGPRPFIRPRRIDKPCLATVPRPVGAAAAGETRNCAVASTTEEAPVLLQKCVAAPVDGRSSTAVVDAAARITGPTQPFARLRRMHIFSYAQQLPAPPPANRQEDVNENRGTVSGDVTEASAAAALDVTIREALPPPPPAPMDLSQFESQSKLSRTHTATGAAGTGSSRVTPAPERALEVSKTHGLLREPARRLTQTRDMGAVVRAGTGRGSAARRPGCEIELHRPLPPASLSYCAPGSDPRARATLAAPALPPSKQMLQLRVGEQGGNQQGAGGDTNKVGRAPPRKMSLFRQHIMAERMGCSEDEIELGSSDTESSGNDDAGDITTGSDESMFSDDSSSDVGACSVPGDDDCDDYSADSSSRKNKRQVERRRSMSERAHEAGRLGRRGAVESDSLDLSSLLPQSRFVVLSSALTARRLQLSPGNLLLRREPIGCSDHDGEAIGEQLSSVAQRRLLSLAEAMAGQPLDWADVHSVGGRAFALVQAELQAALRIGAAAAVAEATAAGGYPSTMASAGGNSFAVATSAAATWALSRKGGAPSASASNAVAHSLKEAANRLLCGLHLNEIGGADGRKRSGGYDRCDGNAGCDDGALLAWAALRQALRPQRRGYACSGCASDCNWLVEILRYNLASADARGNQKSLASLGEAESCIAPVLPSQQPPADDLGLSEPLFEQRTRGLLGAAALVCITAALVTEQLGQSMLSKALPQSADRPIDDGLCEPVMVELPSPATASCAGDYDAASSLRSTSDDTDEVPASGSPTKLLSAVSQSAVSVQSAIAVVGIFGGEGGRKLLQCVQLLSDELRALVELLILDV